MLCFVVSLPYRVEEYIASGRDQLIVDPDPNKIYTKRKARECTISLPDSSSQNKASAGVKYPSTGLKRAKTFLQDEYLKDVEANDDEHYFYFKCKCYHSYKKHDAPHTIQVALCIISG